VVTDDLRVRTKPQVSDDSIKLEPLLWEGALLFVLDGPVAGSGFDWYLVQPMSEVDLQIHPDPPEYGWVAAAGKDGEAWLAPWPDECFASPLGWLAYDLTAVPPPLSGLACFGDQRLTFAAEVGVPEIDCGVEPVWYVEPGWLDGCIGDSLLLAEPGNRDEERVMWATVGPDVDLAAIQPMSEGSWRTAEVEGQYDHPEARACHAEWVSEAGGTEPRPRVLVVLGCRSQFVIAAIKPLP
jgi:hypothetical protein